MEPVVDIQSDTEQTTVMPQTKPSAAAASKAEDRTEFLSYPQSLPYYDSIETIEEMDARLDLILRRLLDCVATNDYDIGVRCFLQAQESTLTR